MDPYSGVVGLVSLAVFALHGTDGILSRDLGIYAYAGQQVADGVPPYVGVLNRAGPLAHLLPGLGAALARLMGMDDLLGIRLLFLLMAVGCVVLVHLLGRDLFGSPWAGVASAAAFLSFSGFIVFASSGPREKTPMLLFLLLALLAAGRRRWLVAGFLLGLATLVLQIILTVGAPALVVAALLGEHGRGRLTACLRVAAGGATALAVAVLYFVVVGHLHDFVEGFVTINATYTQAGPWGAGDWARVVRGYGASTAILVGGLVALPVLAVGAHRRSDPATPMLVGLTVGAVTGVAWMARDFDSWPDVFPVLPLAALGAGGIVTALARRLDHRRGIALTVAWSLVATGLALTFSLGERDDRLVAQRRSVDAVLAVLPDATIVSLQAPQPLVLAGRRNPTRHQMFSNGLADYVDDTWPGGLPGFQQQILDTRPDLIAIGTPGNKQWRRAMGVDYTRVGRAPGWIWMARRSLGPEVLQRLTDGLRSGAPAR
ncbi:MAG: glycosyltransferase family 39 protein [Nocardioides sp.]